MLVRDFDFHLPPELIAQHPPAERDGARMLTLERKTGALADCAFRDLPGLLQAGDLVVFNNSRVMPARLFARRAGLRTQRNSPAPSGLVEVLLTEQVDANTWRALVKPGRKVQTGETLHFVRYSPDRTGASPAPHAAQPSSSFAEEATEDRRHPVLTATVVSTEDRGERLLQFETAPDFFERLETLGHIPLPPYLHRPDTPEDRARYQTVYADPASPGSAAAPTAGLHFTPAILQQLAARGVTTAAVTLHVGLGTFQPVQVQQVADIHLHREHFTLSAAAATAINSALAEGRRIVAVGTTTVRTLEHCAREALASGTLHLEPHSGSTNIFLKPGDPFHLVGALLTNFHLPQSTLLMLVGAFAGQANEPAQGIRNVLQAYEHAVRNRYRFFSYGDCMWIS